MTPDYDILLGDHNGLHGYRVRNFSRDSAPVIAPRFSSGAQSESSLDLLKSKSLDNFSGGMFQRQWDEDTKASRIYGIFNRYDGNLYPAPKAITPVMASGSGSVPSQGDILAKAESSLFTFIACGQYNAGNYINQLYKITKFTGQLEKITLPSAISSSANCLITGLVIHKGFLYVCGKQTPTSYFEIYRMKLSDNTFTATGGHNGVTMIPLRGSLYLFNVDGGIYLETNETTTMTATFIDQPGFGTYDTSPFKVAAEFNGAIYFSMADGLYRFDGNKSAKLLSISPDLLVNFNGALYMYAGNWLYRFDGANLEKLQQFGEELVSSMSATNDRLYISTRIMNGTYSMEDRPESSTQTVLRVYYWDGAGWYLYNERVVPTGLYLPAHSIFACTDQYVFSVWSALSDSGTITNAEWAYLAPSQLGALEFTTSDFDDGFPNILKSFEQFRLLFSNKHANDVIVVKYQFYDGAGWQTWQTLTSNASINIEVNNPLPKLNLRLRVNVQVTTFGSGTKLSFKGASLGYTLQPRSRWRWQTLLKTEGNGKTRTRNNVAIDTDSNVLANTVIQAIKQKTPLFLAVPDYARLVTAVNAAGLTFIFGGTLPIYTDPYGDPVYICIKNNAGIWEILKVGTVSFNVGTDQTTVTVTARGYLGITPGSFNINAEMRPMHKVYITRMLRESPDLSPDTYAEQPTLESQLQREFGVEMTEV